MSGFIRNNKLAVSLKDNDNKLIDVFSEDLFSINSYINLLGIEYAKVKDFEGNSFTVSKAEIERGKAILMQETAKNSKTGFIRNNKLAVSLKDNDNKLIDVFSEDLFSINSYINLLGIEYAKVKDFEGNSFTVSKAEIERGKAILMQETAKNSKTTTENISSNPIRATAKIMKDDSRQTYTLLGMNMQMVLILLLVLVSMIVYLVRNSHMMGGGSFKYND